MSLDNILTSPSLAGMRADRQWVAYVAYPNPKKPGKLVKIPVHPSTGMPCSVVDPTNWTDAHTAAEAVRRFGAGHGLAYCFVEGSGRWFVDLDRCRQPDGSWSALAQQLITQALPGAAVEISASGNGLHLFGRGTVPPHGCKNDAHHAELYTGGRFVAMTGTALQGDCEVDLSAGITWTADSYFPPRATGPAGYADDGPCAEWCGPTDDDELLRRMLKSKPAVHAFSGRATFADLWDNNLPVLAATYPGDGADGIDRSSADAALAQLLAFWTGKDQGRMIALMMRSGLLREKYEREDYLPRTVRNACAMQREVLQDAPVVPPPSVPAAAPSAPPPPTTAGMQPREGATFLSPEQARVLFAGCFYVADVHRVLVPGGKLYKPDQFKAVFGGHSFAMDARNERVSRNAFEAFTESQALRAPVVDGTCFQPRLDYGTVVTTEGRSRVNQFWPAQVRRVPGDATPFLRHVQALFPRENDGLYLVYWLAHCVQHLGYKSQWMPLLVGAEGNGKSLFSRCLAYAVGHRYTHWPDASKLGGAFNAWMFGRLAICIEDLKIGDVMEVWEKLKPMITGESLEIEGKGIDQRTDEVCANIIANSNHRDAIRATMNDRRVCHLWCAQQSEADVTRDGLDTAYHSGLYDWLKADGYAIVADYLMTLDIPAEFGLRWFMGRAPKTTSHLAAIDASRGPIEQEILESVERGDPGFCGGWVSSGALDKLLERTNRQRTIAPNKRREILQSLGYDWHPGLLNGRVNNPVLPDNAKVKLFVRLDHPQRGLTVPAAIGAAYSAAQPTLGA